MNIGEMFVQLGVVSDKAEVQKFTQSIRGMTSSTVAGIFALSGLSLGLVEMTSNTIELASGLGTFRSETGLSIMELQRWQQAAKQFGISADVVTGSVTGIADAITQITKMSNGAPAMAFGRLGVNWANKSPFEILKLLRQRYKQMDPNEFRMFASQVGVNSQMMKMFSLSDKDFGNAMNTAPAMSNANLAAVQAFQAELAKFNIVVMQSFIPVLAAITPHMGELANKIGELLGAIAPAAGNVASVAAYGKKSGFKGWQAYPGGVLSALTDYMAGESGEMTGYGKKGAPGGAYANWKDPMDTSFSESVVGQSLSRMTDKLSERIDQLLAKTNTIMVEQNITVERPEDVAGVSADNLRDELSRTTKHLNNQGR